MNVISCDENFSIMYCFRFSNSFILSCVLFLSINTLTAQISKPVLHYTVSVADTANHYFQVTLSCIGWKGNDAELKMPQWMPGYYQIMHYAKSVEDLKVTDASGRTLTAINSNENTWHVAGLKSQPFRVSYRVKADKKFVANSYVDGDHAYLIPAALFFYINGYINTPVTVRLNMPKRWKNIATCLQQVNGKKDEFTAPDFDILYDSPLLAGDLQELPSFAVKGIKHRFIGYKMSSFDEVTFMNNLKKVVEAASNIIGDIPYKNYTFIGIGPGRGGIEHLNNTTVSFDGKELNTADGMNRMMNFLAHEYFHHYNVKRIRPFELGPFDYDKGSRTNLLWISEGLSVYYEYLAVMRAGLIDEQTLLKDFEGNMNAHENNPGRLYQSLAQASYETWSDGPFGKQGADANKSISYYDKGPLVGLLLDFTIRNSTNNSKSLDDVMRLLYWQYYKGQSRGFTDAEFQLACETVAGMSLASFFDYVYSTKELDYTSHLGFAGLKLIINTDTSSGKKKFSIKRKEDITPEQVRILQSWMGK